MASQDEVQSFLDHLHSKMAIWGVLYLDRRGKNFKTLVKLEIPPKQRDEVIKALEVMDYSEGPKEDNL